MKFSRQTTLRSQATVVGVGVHSGSPVSLTIGPASVDAGLVFVRTGLEGGDREVQATSRSVIATEFQTVLGDNEGPLVSTVEHVLAALRGMGFTERPPVKPLIAAVEGYALAGGTELALATDLIVAATNSAFGIPETKRGLVAGGGGLLRLPQRIPYQIAMELALTGDNLSADVNNNQLRGMVTVEAVIRPPDVRELGRLLPATHRAYRTQKRPGQPARGLWAIVRNSTRHPVRSGAPRGRGSTWPFL